MHQLLVQIIFYLFAVIAVFSALMVITQNNPVRSVLFLVLAFFASSVLWLLLEAEFLALILVLVYVGAVMTLFLFVVMMLDIDVVSIKGHFIRYLPLGLMMVALLTGLLLVSLPENVYQKAVERVQTAPAIQSELIIAEEENVPTDEVKIPVSNTESLGLALMNDYVFAFELAAVILLAAIIASITLAHRNKKRSRQQDIRDQIMTRRDDRVQLVSMKPEQK